jgi:hypothetical protein
MPVRNLPSSHRSWACTGGGQQLNRQLCWQRACNGLQAPSALTPRLDAADACARRRLCFASRSHQATGPGSASSCLSICNSLHTATDVELTANGARRAPSCDLQHSSWGRPAMHGLASISLKIHRQHLNCLFAAPAATSLVHRRAHRSSNFCALAWACPGECILIV